MSSSAEQPPPGGPRAGFAPRLDQDEVDLDQPITPAGQHPPVQDWDTDFDHTVTEYAQNAPEVWRHYRESCPVAHTERFGGAWFPARHSDVEAIAHDTDHFSSRGVIVNDLGFRGQAPVGFAPPITSDPPFHQIARKLLLGPFSPKAVAALEPAARETCRSLLRDTIAAAEGSDQRGGRRGNHYAIALGSAREAFVALRAAEAWGFVGPLPDDVRETMNRVIGTLVKVAR